MLKKNIDVEFKITPIELAEQFCEMWSTEQADFFNAIGIISSTWDSDLVFQLQSIVDTGRLDANGINVMRKIGEYSVIDNVK